MESFARVEPSYRELHDLLDGGLPLENVGPRLRDAARRALLSGDVERMRAAVRTISAELRRRGELPLAALFPHHTHGLAHAGDPDTGNGQDRTTGQDRSNGLEHTLEAMQMAQDLQVGGPNGGQVREVLEGALDLLQRYTPEIELKILLFEELEKSEQPGRVFALDRSQLRPRWFGERRPGCSVSMTARAGLPSVLADGRKWKPDATPIFAVPLYAPVEDPAGNEPAREAGLLFLRVDDGWTTDTILQIGVKLSQFVTERWQVHQDVNRMIQVDALTGLFNRGFLDNHLPLLLERAKRNKTPLALVIADIDMFKSVNSEYGLLIGDQVLQMVARRLKEEVRKVDVVCRRGGEEFAIILPEADFAAVKEVITRLLKADFTLETAIGDQPTTIPVRLSFGVSIFPDNATDDQQLHNQAEYLMLRSKDRGRNRCHYWRNDGNHLAQLPAQEAGG